jgi:DNA repair exonuclease SbcCD nuclease subunit
MLEFVVTTDWHLGKLERFFPQDQNETIYERQT